LRSTRTLFRFWGAMSLIALAIWKVRYGARLITIASVWLVLTLLPYCFLTYMPTVPSRHTYLGSVSLSLVVGAALLELRQRTEARHGRKVIAGICAAIILHESLYLWLKKHKQFEARAQPTERLWRLVVESPAKPIHVKCFPLPAVIADEVVRLRVEPGAARRVVFEATEGAEEVDLCAGSELASQ